MLACCPRSAIEVESLISVAGAVKQSAKNCTLQESLHIKMTDMGPHAALRPITMNWSRALAHSRASSTFHLAKNAPTSPKSMISAKSSSPTGSKI
jgi:hypothetical protein